MSTQPTQDAIRHVATVNVPVDGAFVAFTQEMGAWWPRENTFARVLGAPGAFETVSIEPRVGGRWVEREADGREIPWGRVVLWAPPRQIGLTWQIRADGLPEPDPTKASVIGVRFTPRAPGSTQVEVVHGAFERHGAKAGAIWHDAMDSAEGWPKFLARYAAHVTAVGADLA